MRSRAPVVADPSYFIGVVTYFRGWDAMLRRQYVALGNILSFPIVVGAAAAVASAFENLGIVPFIVIPWIAVAIVLYVRWIYSPCPACRRPFMIRSVFARPHSMECAHCGLRKFTPYAGGKPPGTSAASYFRFRRRARQGLCGYCGYDLRAAPSGICPECGAPLPERPAAFGQRLNDGTSRADQHRAHRDTEHTEKKTNGASAS